jgi:hypothetical protein
MTPMFCPLPVRKPHRLIGCGSMRHGPRARRYPGVPRGAGLDLYPCVARD